MEFHIMTPLSNFWSNKWHMSYCHGMKIQIKGTSEYQRILVKTANMLIAAYIIYSI